MKVLYRILVGILMLQAVPGMAMGPHDFAEAARRQALLEERNLKEQQAIEIKQAQALVTIENVYEQHDINLTNANPEERKVLIRMGNVFLGKTAIPVHGRQAFLKLLNSYEGFHPALFNKYNGLRDALEEFIDNQ